MIPVITETVRCATWACEHEIDPIGTAGTYDGFLLLDLPLPWPRDIGELVGGAPAIERATQRSIRVQATVPSDDGVGRAVLYRRPTGEPFRSMVRTAMTVPPEEVLAAADMLLLDVGPTAGDGSDVLVCTHGRRDTCCGSSGTRLATDLATAMGASIPLQRTSHTGGHRFAPTCVMLPEATSWAFADPDLVARVLHRTGDAADVADRYRGCAGLRSARHQALEREVLREVGWALFDRRRHGIDLDGDRVALLVEEDDGTLHRWEAEVAPGRRMPVPECGSPVDGATKTQPEWVVSDLRRLGPTAPA